MAEILYDSRRSFLPRRRKSGKSGTIAAIVVAVVAACIMLVITSAWNDYAIISQSLSAPNSSPVPSVEAGQALTVGLYLANSGNMAVMPTCTICVINATILNITIPGAAPQELSEFASYTSTTATISNLEIVADQSSTLWASLCVTPDPNVTSFEVVSSASLTNDLLHVHNQVVVKLPDMLFYNLSDDSYPYTYTLVQS